MKASRTRYGVVVLAIGLAVLSYVQRVAISGAAGPISSDLHLSKEQMGMVFGAFGLAYALFEIPMGLLGDRVGVRRALLQIVLAWSAFTALTGAAWSAMSLVAIRFAFGAGEAGCFPNLTRMLSSWLPARERVTAQSLMWACTRWGGALTPPLTLVCITWFGWRHAFVGFALLGVLWCIVFLAWFRDDPATHSAVNEAEREYVAGISRANDARRRTRLGEAAADETGCGTGAAVFLFFLRVVLLHHVAADVFARRAWTIRGACGGVRHVAASFRRIRLTGRGNPVAADTATSHCIHRLSGDGDSTARVYAGAGGGASDGGDGPGELCERPDHADFVGHVRRDRRRVHGDGGGGDEHAGEPGRICCAGDWRSDSRCAFAPELAGGIC